MTLPPRTRAINSADDSYKYVHANGDFAFLVCRWNAKGEKAKRLAQYTVQDGAWVAKGYPAKDADGKPLLRPLYRLPTIVNEPSTNVLIVEGEKTCEGASQYVPDGWIVTTWSGGVPAVDKTDWTPLIGLNVVVWPDNDDPGFKAAHKIAAACGARVLTLPDDLPAKWDLADELPDHLNSDIITGIIIREPPKPAELIKKPDITNTSEIRYLPLGSDGNRTFYFLTMHSGTVLERNSGELRKYDGCMDLITDLGYWANRYGDQAGPNWKRAGDEIITESRKRGLFDEALSRGRGVWIDPLGVIVHTGNSVFVDSKETHPVLIKSRHFYPFKTRLFPDFSAAAATTNEGQKIRDICSLIRWERPIDGLFLAGLIATAPICGALKWRTHGWITGSRGTGKTWIMEEIIGKLLNHIALKVLGETTAPGIRSELRNDARPVLFDESEGETAAGQIRIEALIGLMRAASRQTDAKILKGSSNHKSASFDIQAQFICGAINNGLKRAADTTRTLVLTLQANSAITDADRRASTEHFAKLEAAVKSLPSDMSTRLLKRMAGLVPVVRANADLFMRLIARHFADARIGDQVGTVLAGAYALTHDKILDEIEAMKMLATLKWDSLTQGPATDDGQTMINHLVSHRLNVRNDSGIGHDRTIGELMARAANLSTDAHLGTLAAKEALLRVGIRFDMGQGDVPGFTIAKRHNHLDRLFESSDYPGGYSTFLGRCQGAEQTEPRRYAGVQSRGVWLPADVLIGSSETGNPGQMAMTWGEGAEAAE